MYLQRTKWLSVVLSALLALSVGLGAAPAQAQTHYPTGTASKAHKKTAGHHRHAKKHGKRAAKHHRLSKKSRHHARAKKAAHTRHAKYRA